MAENMEQIDSQLLAMSVSDLLEQESRAADVLKTLEMPIKGNEEKSVLEVCEIHQINEDDLLFALQKIKNAFNYPSGIFGWSPELIVRYLEEEHHAYTCSLLEDAAEFKVRAYEIHSSHYPKLKTTCWYFEKLKEKLEYHLRFQEKRFFPSVIRLLTHVKEPNYGLVQSLNKQISLIQKDQNEIEYQVGLITELTNNFNPPTEADTSLRLFYSTLRHLKMDLKKHHFLEEQYLIARIESLIKLN